MGFKQNKIRPIAIALIKRGSEILVDKGFDEVKGEYFYRPLGGGIKFGETAVQTLNREFREELSCDLKVGKRLDVYENLFTFNGEEGHELIFIHEAEFMDRDLYERAEIPFIEEKRNGAAALWLKLTDDLRIYPEIIKKFK